jgi:hypothetical protein
VAATSSTSSLTSGSPKTQVATAEVPNSSDAATSAPPAPPQPAVPVPDTLEAISAQAYPAAMADSSISASTGTSSNGKRGMPAPSWTAQTAAISVSGPYITTSSIDGDSMIMSSQFLERELAGPYRFTQHQVSHSKLQ